MHRNFQRFRRHLFTEFIISIQFVILLWWAGFSRTGRTQAGPFKKISWTLNPKWAVARKLQAFCAKARTRTPCKSHARALADFCMAITLPVCPIYVCVITGRRRRRRWRSRRMGRKASPSFPSLQPLPDEQASRCQWRLQSIVFLSVLRYK